MDIADFRKTKGIVHPEQMEMVELDFPSFADGIMLRDTDILVAVAVHETSVAHQKSFAENCCAIVQWGPNVEHGLIIQVGNKGIGAIVDDPSHIVRGIVQIHTIAG